MKSIEKDILTQIKKQQREAEIQKYGKLISFRTVIQRDKSKYTRKSKHKQLW